MLNFKSFLLTEAKKESKSGEAANTNGVRHELMTLGVLNHMAKHHGSVKGKSGKEYPNLLKMNNDELHNFYHKNVATGDFNEEMPKNVLYHSTYNLNVYSLILTHEKNMQTENRKTKID